MNAKATDDRRNLAGDYYVVVSPDLAHRLKLRSWAALVHAHPALPRIDDPRKKRDYIAIHCRVFVELGYGARHLDSDTILVDQTLRNALGIPFSIFPKIEGVTPARDGPFKLYLFPASRNPLDSLRRSISSVFGTRYVAVRSTPAAVVDIEKGYVRVPDDVLNVVGAQSADDLVVERPIALAGDIIEKFSIISERVSTAAASAAFLERRQKLVSEPTHRYPDSRKVLYDYTNFAKSGVISWNQVRALAGREQVESDIPPIFMDLDARRQGTWNFPDQSEADYITPFMVRRSVWSAAMRDSLTTVTTFGLTMFQLWFFFAEKTKIRPEELVAGVAVALLVSLGFLAARLRQQI